MTEDNRGDWMLTYSGKRFHPLDPSADEFDIRDIARGLSNTCRYSGHVKQFYSVAQHSVLACRQAPREFKLDALLHDRSEAYISDIVTPAKHALPDYMRMEERIESVSAPVFGVQHPMPAEVKVIDRRLLVTEAPVLLPKAHPWWLDPKYPAPYDIKITPWTPNQSYRAFMAAYRKLTDS